MKIMAADGTFLANRGVTGGKELRLSEMAPAIPQAVIAIEDHRFHTHWGFDPIGFARAMVVNVTTGRMRQGGSTLTQQLAKNLFLTAERNIPRKIQELVLAFWLEANYSKAEILELYLNRVYFGAGATGVDAASRRYFGKSARDVTIAEAALLAGLLKAPSRYNPAVDANLAQARAQTVLAAMKREGYRTEDGGDAAEAGAHAKHFRNGPEHYIADMIANEVARRLPDIRADIVVETTVDPFMMTAAQQALATALVENGKADHIGQGALVALAPDGAVRALIGGRSYADSQFNRATEAQRQPGSAFKSFVYLAAMESGLTADSIRDDSPVRYGSWQPANYNRTYEGPVTLRHAFARSTNTVAARLTMEVGPRRVADTAQRLGIASPLAANGSLALGTSEVTLMDLTASHAPFANGGMKAAPYLVDRITGSDGTVLYQRKRPGAVRVVSVRELVDMQSLFAATLDDGTGRVARLRRSAGGKTGTSQGFRDALFVGFTADLVTGIWLGNDDNSPMKRVTGGGLPAGIFASFMRDAHLGLPDRPLPGGQLVVAMPTGSTVPLPEFRPVRDEGTVEIAPQVAGLRQRVRSIVRDRAESAVKRSILDILSGR